MINYDPFWAYLADHGISTYKLINSYGVSKEIGRASCRERV